MLFVGLSGWTKSTCCGSVEWAVELEITVAEVPRVTRKPAAYVPVEIECSRDPWVAWRIMAFPENQPLSADASPVGALFFETGVGSRRQSGGRVVGFLIDLDGITVTRIDRVSVALLALGRAELCGKAMWQFVSRCSTDM